MDSPAIKTLTKCFVNLSPSGAGGSQTRESRHLFVEINVICFNGVSLPGMLAYRQVEADAGGWTP